MIDWSKETKCMYLDKPYNIVAYIRGILILDNGKEVLRLDKDNLNLQKVDPYKESLFHQAYTDLGTPMVSDLVNNLYEKGMLTRKLTIHEFADICQKCHNDIDTVFRDLVKQRFARK